MSKITRKEFIKRGVLTTGALYAGALFADAVKAAPTGLQASSKKPNLLIIFPDQLRADALGYMKKDPVKTPNLDIFAKQSRNFTQASAVILCAVLSEHHCLRGSIRLQTACLATATVKGLLLIMNCVRTHAAFRMC